MNSLRKIPWLLGLAGLLFETMALQPALAQPAPVPRAIVPAEEAPEAMSALFNPLGGGEQTIAIPGAAWLQLQIVRGAARAGRCAYDNLRVGRLAELFAGGD